MDGIVIHVEDISAVIYLGESRGIWNKNEIHSEGIRTDYTHGLSVYKHLLMTYFLFSPSYTQFSFTQFIFVL